MQRYCLLVTPEYSNNVVRTASFLEILEISLDRLVEYLWARSGEVLLRHGERAEDGRVDDDGAHDARRVALVEAR